MTTFKRLLALLTALTLCFALCACGSKDDPAESPSTDPTNTESPTQSDTAEGESLEDIDVDLTKTMFEFASGLEAGGTAATINGTAIPNELFLYWLSYDCYYLDYYYYQNNASVDFSDPNVTEYLLSDVKSAVTYYAVLRQLCDEAGITVTEEQLAQYQAMVDNSVNTSYGGDYDLFYQGYGLSPDSHRYIYENNYLYNNYASEVIPEPTNEDLEQYVEDNGIFSVKHILLMTTSEDIVDEDGNVTQTAMEYNTQLFDRAVALLEEINAADDPAAKFDELMLANSEDSGLTAYPDGYTFSNSDSLVGGFREATLQLEVGEISGVVTTDYGYHIMLRLPVDAAAYHDAFVASKLDALLAEKTAAAQLELSEEIAALDVAGFYNRYMAYSLAMYNSVNSSAGGES